jgi:hypothetical protein
MEVVGMPTYRKHHFFGLDCLLLPFRNLSIRPKLDQFVVRIEIELGFIKGHDIMPGSLLLTWQHAKKLSRECYPIQLLSV